MTKSTHTGVRFAQVILDSPLPQLDHPFDYAVPERLRDAIAVGQKVKVPLRSGNRFSDAWVIGLVDETTFAGHLSEIDSIVSPVASLTPDLYHLARTVADRQAGSAVDVIRLAIPPRYVRAEKQYFAAQSESAFTSTFTKERASAQGIDIDTIECPIDIASHQRVSAVITGPMQDLAIKTFVPAWISFFTSLVQQAIASNTSAIVCVPDFRDVDLLERTLHSIGLGDYVVRSDAGVPGALRWTNYLRILNEDPIIVLGNRSAVYAPVRNLGLIALWDSADESFTEPLAPYAHARDVALIRQSESLSTLVLASHVPSIEEERLVKLGYMSRVVVGDKTVLPIATDLAKADEHQRTARIPPVALVEAKHALNQGAVLIQVAKPGYASSARCESCRERAVCAHCQGPLRLSAKNSVPDCRWCGKLASNWRCQQCGSSNTRAGQAGTLKTGEDLAKTFPGVRIIFSEAGKVLSAIPDGPCLVIATAGTEPVAPRGYQAVLILDGESMRSRDDIDADVSALRTWLNASALASPSGKTFIAGTGDVLGQVLESGKIHEFTRQTLSEREALGLPPSTRAAILTGSREAIRTAEKALADIPHRMVLGPVPYENESSRLIVTFDYKDGPEVATKLRGLVLNTAIVNRKPSGMSNTQSRILRLSVRIDDSALRGIG